MKPKNNSNQEQNYDISLNDIPKIKLVKPSNPNQLRRLKMLNHQIFLKFHKTTLNEFKKMLYRNIYP